MKFKYMKKRMELAVLLDETVAVKMVVVGHVLLIIARLQQATHCSQY